MSNTNFATNGVIGAGFDARTADPVFELGTTVPGNKNTIWVYVMASVSLSEGACAVDGTTFIASGGTGYTATKPFAANEHGWVRQTAPATA